MSKASSFRAGVFAALTVGAFAACSEEAAPPPPLPEGPPDLRIVSFDAPGVHTGFDAGLGGCFPVGSGSAHTCDSAVSGPGCGFVIALKTNAGRQIPLELPDGSQPRFWTFQPPLGCNGAPDCGYALLLIDPTTEKCAADPAAAVKKIAAGPVISVDFAELQTGLADALGPKTVRVELWPGEGFPDKHHCHATEVTVDFQLTCGSTDGGSRDAGAEASAPEAGLHDAATDAPAPSIDASDASDASVDASKPDGVATDASDGSAESG